MENTEAFAKHRYAIVSPKKMAIVMDLIRGKTLEQAKVILAFDKTKAARFLLKVVKSAEANAKNNMKVDTSEMYVSKVWAEGGPMYKRAKMGSKGRVDPILKRTSHINVSLANKSAEKVVVKKEVKK